SCGFDSTAATTGLVTDAADNCDATPTISHSDATAQGSCVNELIITRTWKVEDNCGNINTQVQTITVSDTTRPSFTVPADVTIYKDASCGFDSTAATTGLVIDAADNCDATPTISHSDATAQGSCVNELIITRTWKVEDNCGNINTQVQTITVSDTTRPSFTVPADV